MNKSEQLDEKLRWQIREQLNEQLYRQLGCIEYNMWERFYWELDGQLKENYNRIMIREISDE